MVDYSNVVWFPRDALSREEWGTVFLENTVTPKGFGVGAAPEPIQGFSLDASRDKCGLPVSYGLSLAEGKGLPVRRNTFASLFKYPKCPTPKENQYDTFENALYMLRADGYGLLQAPTGFGKTVLACWLAANLRTTMLVIVFNELLASQWGAEIKKHLGVEASQVHSNGYRLPGSKVTVAIVNSVLKQSPKWFKKFGLTVWDECHRLGAREFSKSQYLCYSRYRLGMSATPKRKDGCERLFLNYFGNPGVRASQQSMPCDIYQVSYVVPPKMLMAMDYKKTVPPKLSLLAKCDDRNAQLALLIKRGYDNGRNILAVGDRIEQLGIIRSLLMSMGVPTGAIGTVARQKATSSGRTTMTNNMLSLHKSRRILLATYGLAKEGLDIPRLDMGVDLTPRADGEQQIGRIRRYMEGKPRPVWFTMIDVNIPFARRYAVSRLEDYEKAGATIR